MHIFGSLRIVLEILDGLGQAAIDAVGIVEQVRGEFLEPLEIFRKYLLAYLCVQARGSSLQLLKIEFRLFLRFVHIRIVAPFGLQQ